MKNVLCVDCCIRKENSRTRRLEDAFVTELLSQGGYHAEILYLSEQALLPMDEESLLRRDELLAQKCFEHERFRHARRFAQADKIVIAAPFWDLSFPALLKIYIENISVQGITFDCDAQNGCFGICRADRLLYLSTRGGIYEGSPMECGARYFEQLSRFFGIERFDSITAEGLDIGIEAPEAILARSISEAKALAKGF